MRNRTWIVSLVLCFYTSILFSQDVPFQYEGIMAVVELDSLVVEALADGFNTEEFIEIVKEDTSFYTAFHNLRKHAFKAEHFLNFQDKKGRNQANFEAKTEQIKVDSCREMIWREQSATGDFFRNNDTYRYWTAEIYARVFFLSQAYCPVETSQEPPEKPKGLDRYYQELKKFIFQPGEQVQVPLVSKRTALFSEHLRPYYDYRIEVDTFDNIPCYTFTIQTKAKYQESQKSKTVLKFMKTYFQKDNLQVLYRKYSFQLQGLASCDVEMEVQLKKVANEYFPQIVQYKGEWNIPGKRRERGTFRTTLSSFKLD